METAFHKYLATLRDPQQPLSVSGLNKLSDLTAAQVRELQEVWPELDVERRQKVSRELVNLAEDNVDLDFSAVFKLTLQDADPQVRIASIDGLWEDTERGLIDVLLTMARNDPATNARASATGSLGRYIYQAEMGKLDKSYTEKVRLTLLNILHSAKEPVEVRRRALEAIAYLSGNEDVQQLIERAYQDSNPNMRASAVFAMGRNCDERWLGTIIAELSSKTAEMRYEAARASAELEDRRAVPHLVSLIDDGDAEVRHAAVEALGRIGGNVARRVLRKCLDSDDPLVEQLARQALQEMGVAENPSRLI